MSTRGAPQAVATQELMPDLYMVKIPLAGHSVGHINVYVLDGPEGALLIDTGWRTGQSYESLRNGLRQAGLCGLDAVVGVVVTHFHPDHCGLAGLLQDDFGIPVLMHPVDAALADVRYRNVPAYSAMTLTWLKEVGCPDETIREALEITAMGPERVAPFEPETAICDAPIAHGAWMLDVIHTPGHTPGHICLYDAKTRTLFSGDHVFPSINANASYRPGSQGNPLQEYLDSLGYLEQRDIERVMPGHQDPFECFQARIDMLRDRHLRRLRMTLALVRSGRRTIWEIAGALVRSRRSWIAVPTGSRLAAAGETYAHLLWLADREHVAYNRGATTEWFATSASAEVVL